MQSLQWGLLFLQFFPRAVLSWTPTSSPLSWRFLSVTSNSSPLILKSGFPLPHGARASAWAPDRVSSFHPSAGSSRHSSAQAALPTKGCGIGCSDSFVQNVLVGGLPGARTLLWRTKHKNLCSRSFPCMREVKLYLIHMHANIFGGWSLFTHKCVCLCVNQ